MLYVVLISQMFFHGCVQVYLFFNTLSYVPCITMLLLCFILISHIFSRLCKCVPSIMLLLCFVKKKPISIYKAGYKSGYRLCSDLSLSS
ncbi:Os07g0581400, partial [Oryza sativa Japonica Group]